MPLLFSYGTLQQEPVQLATFGRALEGQRDELRRYERAFVPVSNPALVARYGMTVTDTVAFTGKAEDGVEGTTLEVTDEELARSDEYETPFDYNRIFLILASGRAAWVYRHIGSAKENDPAA
jgi:hypothetical protein